MRDGYRVFSIFFGNIGLLFLDVAVGSTGGAYRRALQSGRHSLFRRTIQYAGLGWTKASPEPIELPHAFLLALMWVNIISGFPALVRLTKTDYLLRYWTPSAAHVGCIVLVAGVSAYIFKRKTQAHYGVFEVVVGFCSGYAVAKGVPTGQYTLAQIATLVGAAYVISRGLGNVAESRQRAKEAKEKNPAALVTCVP